MWACVCACAFIMEPDCDAAFDGCECDGLGLVPSNSCLSPI